MRAPWRTGSFGPEGRFAHQEPARVSRRATLAGGALSLAAALTLAACGADPDPDIGTALVPEAAPLQTPDTGSFLAPQPSKGLRAMLDGGPELIVGGERLDVGLLGRFYERHGYEPVWAARPGPAEALANAVLRAGDQGLDPQLYHASLLGPGATLLPLERELLLSDAFLTYADALARGAVPVERRKDDEVLRPEPVDVAAVLDEATDSSDPGAVIEALAPATPSYQALREALRRVRSGAVMRVATTTSRRHRIETTRQHPIETNVLRTIVVNLERQRWLPRRLPADRVWVNVADERLVLYRADQPVFTTRVVVGEDVEKNQSPEFSATIDASFYNPPWVIPADIASAEILPKLNQDPDYLTRNKMIMLANGEVEQLPGPDAGLGLIMFDMPNKFDVYLHDTPDRYIFARDNRRISHGCIRVQNPQEFAALLMDQPIDVIHEGIAMGSTTRNDLPKPVPVFVVYQTAFADADGTLQFRPDFYNRDAAIWRLLQERPQGRVLAAQANDRPTTARPL